MKEYATAAAGQVQPLFFKINKVQALFPVNFH